VPSLESLIIKHFQLKLYNATVKTAVVVILRSARPDADSSSVSIMPLVVKCIRPATNILNGVQATQVRWEVSKLISAGATIVLIDLEEVTFIDSSGLGALVLAFKAVRSMGGKFVLCSVSDQARMLFELTGTDQLFETFANRAEFDRILATTPEQFVGKPTDA